jgi:hypothetical protein
MKGTFFSRPLEWSIETHGENWVQGDEITGVLKIKNHSRDAVEIGKSGVALAFSEIKKVHARAEGSLKIQSEDIISAEAIRGEESLEFPFKLKLDENCSVSDKKATFFLTYGKSLMENHLQLNISPRPLFGKIIGLLDTFYRFKLKEIKSAKTGVEYKLIPPTARDMANLEGLSLLCSLEKDVLKLSFDFQVKKLDTSSITTKINKESVKIKRDLNPKEYSLGKDMINQDQLLKILEAVLSEVKMKAVF